MRLTPREKDVLGQVCAGASSKEIAVAIGVSEQAIKAHISNLFLKFDVTNRAGLATAASDARFDRQQVLSNRYHERARALASENALLRRENAGLRAELKRSTDATSEGGRRGGGPSVRWC